MKKQYVSPKCKIVKCSVATIIAASNDIFVYNDDTVYYTEEQF